VSGPRRVARRPRPLPVRPARLSCGCGSTLFRAHGQGSGPDALVVLTCAGCRTPLAAWPANAARPVVRG
jgi:hypothetical protein